MAFIVTCCIGEQTWTHNLAALASLDRFVELPEGKMYIGIKPPSKFFLDHGGLPVIPYTWRSSEHGKELHVYLALPEEFVVHPVGEWLSKSNKQGSGALYPATASFCGGHTKFALQILPNKGSSHHHDVTQELVVGLGGDSLCTTGDAQKKLSDGPMFIPAGTTHHIECIGSIAVNAIFMRSTNGYPVLYPERGDHVYT